MSLMIIAMSGILLGFLCVMVGFFMENGDGHVLMATPKDKKVRRIRKRIHRAA